MSQDDAEDEKGSEFAAQQFLEGYADPMPSTTTNRPNDLLLNK